MDIATICNGGTVFQIPSFWESELITLNSAWNVLTAGRAFVVDLNVFMMLTTLSTVLRAAKYEGHPLVDTSLGVTNKDAEITRW